jgi:hypothetical protein
MSKSRKLLALVAISALLFGGAACSADDEIAPEDELVVNPPVGVDQITAAVNKLQDQTMLITITTDKILFDGTYDPKAKSGAYTIEYGEVEVQAIALENDLYLKGLPNRPANKWLHFDVSKMPAANPFTAVGDALGGTAFLKAASEPQSLGEGDYTGKLDLRKYVSVETDAARKARANDLANRLGDEAGKLVFAATLDNEDRLTELTIGSEPADENATPEFVASGVFSEFGAKHEAARPAAKDVVEAPADAYAIVE